MRKIVLFGLIMLCALSAFAVNNQKIYSVDDTVYKDIQTLSIASGKGLPYSSGPWTGAELKLMLERVDKNSLTNALKELYYKVEEELKPKKDLDFDTVSFDFGLDVSLEAYTHTSDKVTEESYWYHGFTSRKPFLELSAETWATDNFYGYFEFTLGNTLVDELYSVNFDTNLSWILGNKNADISTFDAFDWGMPYKALAVTGGNNWSLVAGRDKLSWGAGETGNLMLSDSFPVHTFAKFSTFHKIFKYSLIGTIYPNFEKNSDGSINTSTNQDDEVIDGTKSLIAHKVEASLLNNTLNLSATESCMFTIKKGEGFSLAMINPFGFMHNEYVRQYGNSLLVFEADYTPIKGINIYGQFAVDDFALPGAADNVVPSAFGYMLGAKGVYEIGPGILTGNAEFVLTDPYLYLRGYYNGTKAAGSSGYGYDAVYRHFNGIDAVAHDNMFVTYKYGNDVRVLDFKTKYDIEKIGNIGLEYVNIAKGILDINSLWAERKWFASNKPATPVTTDPITGENGLVEYENIISLTATYYTPVKGLSSNLAADLVFINNYKNVTGNITDFQFTIGATYSI